MISNELISMLCCPETKQPLTVANAFLIEKINQKIEKRELKTRGGETALQKIDGGLIREDKQCLFAVRNDIPVMLINEAIPLQNL